MRLAGKGVHLRGDKGGPYYFPKGPAVRTCPGLFSAALLGTVDAGARERQVGLGGEEW